MNKELYYIQNGYVGNAVYWWALDSKGYTTDVNEAQKYTYDEMKSIVNNRRQDIGWPVSYIDENAKAHKTIIDAQYISKSKSIERVEE